MIPTATDDGIETESVAGPAIDGVPIGQVDPITGEVLALAGPGRSKTT